MTTHLIVTDLDRTLFPRGAHPSGYTADTLRMCREHGIAIAYATARPARAAHPLLPSFLPDYILANNGATLCTGSGESLEECPIPGEILERLLPALIRHPLITGWTLEMGDHLLTNADQWDDWTDLHLWKPVYHPSGEVPNSQCVKLSIECSNGDILQELLSPYPLLRIYGNTGEYWKQVTHRDASKENAVRLLARRLGISLSQIAAFGDDENDIEMLRVCGTGVAVEDAVPDALTAARHICERAADDGPARWIREHILGIQP